MEQPSAQGAEPDNGPSIAWHSGPVHHRLESVPAGGVAKGYWVRNDQLLVSVQDLGFRQGVTAVERLRTYDGRPADLSQHLIRWRRTLDYLGIAIHVDEAEIAQRMAALIEQNKAWCGRVGDFGITLLATPGCEAHQPQAATEIMHLNPLDPAKIQRHRTAGQPLIITDVHQPSPRAWPRDIKVRCRLHYYLADRVAQQIDAAALGLLIDADGSVTETSVASIAICQQAQILSPPIEQVLPGTTQQAVERVAQQLGLSWSYQAFFPADVRQAQEVWLMGTDGGLWFANRVDGVLIGGGQPGPMYQKVLPRFDAAMRQVAG